MAVKLHRTQHMYGGHLAGCLLKPLICSFTLPHSHSLINIFLYISNGHNRPNKVAAWVEGDGFVHCVMQGVLFSILRRWSLKLLSTLWPTLWAIHIAVHLGNCKRSAKSELQNMLRFHWKLSIVTKYRYFSGIIGQKLHFFEDITKSIRQELLPILILI